MEVGNKFPVGQVRDHQRGIHHLIIFSCHTSSGGVNIMVPCHQGDLLQDGPDCGGRADSDSGGPSLRCCVVNVGMDVRNWRRPW